MKKKKLENTIWKYSFDADTWDGISLWAIPPPPKTKKRATKNHCLGPHPPQPPYHIQTPLTCQCWGEWKCHTSLGQFVGSIVGWSIPPNFSRLSQPTHDQSVEVTSPLPAESGSGSSPYPVSVISSGHGGYKQPHSAGLAPKKLTLRTYFPHILKNNVFI